MEKIKGKIKRNVFYTVETEDGKIIPVDNKKVKIYGLKDGSEVIGHINHCHEQIQYDNDEWSRSIEISDEFVICEIKNKEEE